MECRPWKSGLGRIATTGYYDLLHAIVSEKCRRIEQRAGKANRA